MILYKMQNGEENILWKGDLMNYYNEIKNEIMKLTRILKTIARIKVIKKVSIEQVNYYLRLGSITEKT